MHMCVDEPGRDQAAAIVGDPGPGMGGAQPVGGAYIGDAPVLHQHGPVAVVPCNAFAAREGIAVEPQNLSQKKIAHTRPQLALARP